jgi:hypothetical protein
MGARAQHAPAYRHMCKLLRQWRKAAALTQRALGLRLKRPYSFVWKTEAGERRIDPIEFRAWCMACGKHPGEAIEELTR